MKKTVAHEQDCGQWVIGRALVSREPQPVIPGLCQEFLGMVAKG
jgi:hypothetical protein